MADALITGLADSEKARIAQGTRPAAILKESHALRRVQGGGKNICVTPGPRHLHGGGSSEWLQENTTSQANSTTDDEKCYFCGGTGNTPRSLYAAPNAPRSATPVGNVENRTTPTECAGQSNPRPRMPSLAHVATSQPTG